MNYSQVGDNAKVDTLLEVHSLFKTFHFKELYLQFDSSSNVLDVLYRYDKVYFRDNSRINFRFRNIILSNVDVTIVWENLKDINIEDLRIALQSFPEMEKISLDIPDGHIENTVSHFGEKNKNFMTFYFSDILLSALCMRW